jgi:tape measure domain-containing protein
MFNANKAHIEITAADKTAGAFDSVVNRLKRTTSEFSSFQKLVSFGALGVGIGSFATATIRAIDTYTKFNAQLKIATNSTREFNLAQENVLEISRRAQTDISAIGSTYARLNNALRDFGATQTQISNVTETLALSLKVNGASAEEAASAMLQLSQAFGKGKLDGDEFRTAMEAAPNVMRALAQSIGVPFGSLKDLAAQGKITSEVMLSAFNDPALLKALREQSEQTRTVTGEWENFTNRLTLVIGKINETTGASRILIGVLEKASTLLSVFEGGEKGSRLRNFIDRLPQNQDITQRSTEELRRIARNSKLSTSSDGQEFGKQAQDELERRRKLIANSPLGRADSNAVIAPNFGAGVQAQDINKIRALEEEKRRRAEASANNFKQEKQRAEEMARKKLDTEQKLYNISSGFDKQLAERELEHIEKVEKEQKRIAEDKAETAKKWFDYEEKKRREIDQEQQEAARRLAEEQRRFAEEINRSLTDALLRGFESGKGFARNFRDTLKNMFQTLVLRPAINFALNSTGITGALGGLGSIFSGGAQAAGGGSGFSLSSLGDIFQSGNSSLISSIESLGTFLSNGQGGLGDILGGAIGQYSSQIANVLPFAGVGLQLLQGNVKGALGAGLGAALSLTPLGPVGGIIGSLVGGSLFGGKKQPPRTVTQLPDVAKQFVDSLNVLSKGFGIDSNASVSARYSGRAGGSGYGRLTGTVNGESIYSNTRFKDAYGEESMKKFIDDVLTGQLQNAIQKLELPEGVKKFFKGLATQQEVADAINTLVAFKAQLKDLPPVFDAIRQAIDTTDYTTSISDLKTRFSAISTFTNFFYTEQEQFATFTKQLTTQFTELNTIVPKTRDEYRALIDGFKVTDKASSDLFAGLVGLAPAMDTYFKQLEAQKQGIDEVNKALAEGLDRNLYSTFADYRSAQATTELGENASGFMANSPNDNSFSLAVEVKALREQGANQQTVLEAMATFLYNIDRRFNRWNGDGLPAERVI